MTSAPSSQNYVTYRKVLSLAVPASIAASVTPLLGVVDVWALAHSNQPLDVAAVGLGSVVFSLAYWTFGFIRMSVAGLTAQATGAEDAREARAALARGVLLGGSIGLTILLLQSLLGNGAFALLKIDSQASDATLSASRSYYDIRIWGAPFALSTYALFGWLTAKGRTDFLMVVSVAMTLLNAILDYAFVVNLQMGANGVAAGTLIAEIFGFLLATFFVGLLLHREGGIGAYWRTIHYTEPQSLARTLSVNRDIFIRTAILAFSFAWFVQRGGAYGDVTLAANQVLLQLFLFTGLALDGTAIAAETLVGQAIGDKNSARRTQRLQSAVKKTFIPALITAFFFVAIYSLGGEHLIALLTPAGDIRDTALEFLFWAAISPLIVVAGFQLDGIFIGATKAKEMRNSMIISAAIFLPASLPLGGQFGNHGLWAAFSCYFLLRAATLGWYFWRQNFWSPR